MPSNLFELKENWQLVIDHEKVMVKRIVTEGYNLFSPPNFGLIHPLSEVCHVYTPRNCSIVVQSFLTC